MKGQPWLRQQLSYGFSLEAGKGVEVDDFSSMVSLRLESQVETGEKMAKRSEKTLPFKPGDHQPRKS